MKKVGVVVFPGVNCDIDTYNVLKNVIGVNVRYVWHTETDLSDLTAIVLPGGFSYGDYLRAGGLARFSPVMSEIKKMADKGYPVLGICNGFQILVEAGLLPGAFLRNKTLRFICKYQTIKVFNNQTIFTHKYKLNQILTIPIAHGEGNYYLTEDDIKSVLDNEQIAFQYSDKFGVVNENTNPNGSVYNIAGIFNKTKNVLGMMPHPERASESILGSIDGKYILEGLC
ncbi:MAG: phosphoribosylformylglycinamidine synthase subunit PurQ [Brevinematales bacterium]|nr:phosphoribosylformylglycinamidine synthase subunit PurQ [Brevinematales bacterium]